MYAKLVNGEILPVSDAKEWSQWYESSDKRMGYTQIGNYRISTIFLGVNMGSEDSPQWFETMIFGEGELDGEQWRYATIVQAILGHQDACQLARDVLEGRFNKGAANGSR